MTEGAKSVMNKTGIARDGRRNCGEDTNVQIVVAMEIEAGIGIQEAVRMTFLEKDIELSGEDVIYVSGL